MFLVFYDVSNGFYIDVGANDPNYFSVTKSFYLHGWYGINIEPLPNKYEALVKYRNRDINLEIGVGEKEGNATFYLKGTGSTLIKNYSTNNNTKEMNIKINTMLNICKKYVPKNTIIQFCKIDVEGSERNVLLGYDFKNYRPKVFCIESTLPGTSIPSFDSFEDILFKNDYSFAYQYKINRFYIDNKITGLREKFIKAEKYLEIYCKNKNITNI